MRSGLQTNNAPSHFQYVSSFSSERCTVVKISKEHSGNPRLQRPQVATIKSLLRPGDNLKEKHTQATNEEML